jgi:hypothetical protein
LHSIVTLITPPKRTGEIRLSVWQRQFPPEAIRIVTSAPAHDIKDRLHHHHRDLWFVDMSGLPPLGLPSFALFDAYVAYGIGLYRSDLCGESLDIKVRLGLEMYFIHHPMVHPGGGRLNLNDARS